jgi:hypothetical protein
MKIQSKIDNHSSLILNHLYGLHGLAFSLKSYGISSTKEQVRKNKLFLQNEPNFRKSQVNVTDLLTREYVQLDTWSIRKNEPKRSQNEPKVKVGKINITTYLTMNYEQRTMNDEKNEPKRTQF